MLKGIPRNKNMPLLEILITPYLGLKIIELVRKNISKKLKTFLK